MSDIPYDGQFQHIEGGEYEFRPDELGPGRLERAGSRESETAMGRTEQEEGHEEAGEEAGPPKLLSYSSKDKFAEPQVYRSTSGAKPPAAPEGKEGGPQEAAGGGQEVKTE